MRIFLTGASGFLGNHLVQYLSKDIGNEIIAVAYQHFVNDNHLAKNNLSIIRLNLCDFHATLEAIQYFAPDVIINCCALTNTAVCEQQRVLAEQINIDTVRNLLESLKSTKLTHQCRFVHVSTDMVFDGTRPGGMYSEIHTPSPVNYYGVTKLRAERLIKEYCDNDGFEAIILRSSLIYGHSEPGTSCFVDWIEKSLLANSPCSLFIDEFRSPVFVGDLCVAIQAVCTFISSVPYSVFHICGSSRISRFDFGMLYAKMRKFSEELIRPALSIQTISACKRPLDISMSYAKAKELLGYSPLSYFDGINQIIAMKEN